MDRRYYERMQEKPDQLKEVARPEPIRSYGAGALDLGPRDIRRDEENPDMKDKQKTKQDRSLRKVLKKCSLSIKISVLHRLKHFTRFCSGWFILIVRPAFTHVAVQAWRSWQTPSELLKQGLQMRA